LFLLIRLRPIRSPPGSFLVCGTQDAVAHDEFHAVFDGIPGTLQTSGDRHN
jgi:hypothetical protein